MPGAPAAALGTNDARPTVESPAPVEPRLEELALEPEPTEAGSVESPAIDELPAEELAVEVVATERPSIEGPATEEPPVEEPFVADPPVEEPSAVEPLLAEPSIAEPPIEEPSAVEPLVAEPSVEEPPVAEPPVEEPSVAEPSVEEAWVDESSSDAAPVKDAPLQGPKEETSADDVPPVTGQAVEESIPDRPLVERVVRIEAPTEREVLAGTVARFPIEAFHEGFPRPRLALLDPPPGASLRYRTDGASEFLWQTSPSDVGETLVTVEAIASDGSARAGTSVLLRVLPEPAEREDGVASETGPDEADPGEGNGSEEAPPAAGVAFDDSTPLRELARELDLHIGFAAYHDLEGDLFTIPDAATYAAVATAEYDILTPENSMKMSFVQPERGSFEWDMPDRIVAFAEASGMAVRGHPLVWRQQIPGWVGRLDDAARGEAMREHVAALVSRYAGRILAWDVVNEALEDDGQLVHTTWYRALGEDYFGEAFRVAHAHDPEASLIYNDYGVETGNAKSDALHALLERELARGTPVHGIGLQMHLNTDEFRYDDMRANVRRFAALGLDIHITEMDVATDWRADPDVEAERQATVYAEILRLCLEEPRCRALQTWGLSDRHAWRGALSGLPFDENFEPKPAVRAMREVMLEFIEAGTRERRASSRH